MWSIKGQRGDKVKTYYLTDPGKLRSHNEDSVTIMKNQSGENLLIVADGMGGHRAGEIASSLAVTHLGTRFSKLASIGNKQDAYNWIKENIQEVNTNILKYSQERENTNGMGSTVVLALLTNDFLIFGNVGDSSGYVMKNNKLHKVTKDHTLVNLLVEAGDLTEEEAVFHPKKNVLMKALGAAQKQEIDIFDVVDPDVQGIFLCSDGLTNMMTKEQIEKVLNDENLSIEEQVEKLVLKSNLRGGTDNISIAYLTKESGETL